MRPVIRNLGIVLSLSLVFSCSKSHNDANAANLRISRIVAHYSLGGYGTTVIDFKYDDQQRVIKIVYSGGDESTGTLITTPFQTYECYYNGTEKNPYKATGLPPGLGFGTEAEMFYRYNNAGQVTWDSTKITGGTQRNIREYTYLPGSILVKKGIYTDAPGGVAGSQVTDSFVINNNNLTEAYYANTSMAFKNYGYKCTYDNKINPVSNLNLTAWMPTDGIDGFPSFIGPGASKNNIVEYVSGITNAQGEFIVQGTNKLAYTYNNAGLPDKCVIKAQRGDNTIKYYYEEK